MTHDFFVARLPGGIGNQLFGLFASRYIKQQTGLQNYLDFEGVDYSHNAGKYDISEFVLYEHETLLIDPMESNHFVRRVLHMQRLKVRIHKNFSSLSRVLRFYSCDLDPLRSEYVSQLIEKLQIQRNALGIFASLSGYFPDFSFYDSLKDGKDKRIELKTKSDAVNLLESLLTNSNVLAIHVRLKDFLLHPNTIGNLSDEYFLNCIRLATEQRAYREIWIFSDDPTEAFRRIEKLRMEITLRFIGLNETLGPCEELLLMSKCNGLVCSNSTFSLWAAKLMVERDVNSQIFIPNSFRRDKKTQIYGVPKNWTVAPTTWL